MRHPRTPGRFVGGTAAHRQAHRHAEFRPPVEPWAARRSVRPIRFAFRDPVGNLTARHGLIAAAVAAAPRLPVPESYPAHPDERPTLAETVAVALFVAFVFAAFALTVYQLFRRTDPNGVPPVLDPPPLMLALDALG
ncbi:MAG TPA: hypothetical protein VF796_00985 [Humisphaera sp.]